MSMPGPHCGPDMRQTPIRSPWQRTSSPSYLPPWLPPTTTGSTSQQQKTRSHPASTSCGRCWVYGVLSALDIFERSAVHPDEQILQTPSDDVQHTPWWSPRDLTPGYFALVMASGIVSMGLYLQGYVVASTVLVAIMAVAYVVLIVLNLWRLAAYRSAMVADFSARKSGV